MSSTAYGYIYVGVECGEAEKNLLRTPIGIERVCPRNCDTSLSSGEYCTKCGSRINEETTYDYSDKFITYAKDAMMEPDTLWRELEDQYHDNEDLKFKSIRGGYGGDYPPMDIFGFVISHANHSYGRPALAIEPKEIQSHISDMSRIAKSLGLPGEVKLYLCVEMH